MKAGFIIPDKLEPWDSVHQGIGYVAAYAEKEGLLDEWGVFRTHGASHEALAAFLKMEWDLIGLTLTRNTVFEAKVITSLVKKTGPAKIVVGGSEVTTIREQIFNQMPQIDYAVIGEGEKTFAELVSYLKHGGGHEPDIPGLGFRKKDGTLCINPPRAFEMNLENFPYPDRKKFLYDYPIHSLIGTRGCPFHCTFCNSSDNWGHRYRERRPKAISEEIQTIIGNDGSKKIFAFNDDMFNLKRAWVREVCRELKHLGVSWWVRGLRSSLMTEEIADLMAGSGCVGVGCGIESASNEALRAMKKAASIEDMMRGVKYLRDRNIHVVGQFIIGNQADTLETVKASIACAHQFSEATFGIAYPIRETYLDRYVREHDLMLREPYPVTFDGKIIDWIIFDTPHFPVEERLKGINLAIENRFYHNIDYNRPGFDQSQKAVIAIHDAPREKPDPCHTGWWSIQEETAPSLFMLVRNGEKATLFQTRRDDGRRPLLRKIDIEKTADHFYAGPVENYPPEKNGEKTAFRGSFEGLAHLRFSGPETGELIFLTETGQQAITIKRCFRRDPSPEASEKTGLWSERDGKGPIFLVEIAESRLIGALVFIQDDGELSSIATECPFLKEQEKYQVVFSGCPDDVGGNEGLAAMPGKEAGLGEGSLFFRDGSLEVAFRGDCFVFRKEPIGVIKSPTLNPICPDF